MISSKIFSKRKEGVEGKYVERYRTGTNVVFLDPDVAHDFLQVIQLATYTNSSKAKAEV